MARPQRAPDGTYRVALTLDGRTRLVTIRQRTDGRWAAAPQARGDRRTFYGHTPADVAAQLTSWQADVERGTSSGRARLTVEAWLREWEASLAGQPLAPRTRQLLHGEVHTHLIPALGQHRLRSLRPDHVQAYLQQRLNDTYAPSTIRVTLGVLRRALRQAERWGLVSRNVAALVDLPRQPVGERARFSREQVQALLTATQGTALHALIAVAVGCGLRRNELLGLRWRDLDLDNRQLAVRVQRGDQRLKTARSRGDVPVPVFVVRALQAHRAQQEVARMLDAAWQEHDLVFPGRHGRPGSTATLWTQWHRACREAKVPELPFHALRHTCASLLSDAGVPLAAAARVLRHSAVSMTAHYNHADAEGAARAVAALDGLLEKE